jgi:hypothetical protein
VTPPLADRRHSSEYAARPSRHGQGGGIDDAIPVAGSLTQDDYRADVRASPAGSDPETRGAWRRTVAWAATRNGWVRGRRRRADPQAGQTLTCERRAALGICDGGRGRRLRSHPDQSRFMSAFVVDRLLLRSTPVGGTLGRKFRKIRFRSFVAGPALSSPQAGPLKVRPAACGK